MVGRNVAAPLAQAVSTGRGSSLRGVKPVGRRQLAAGDWQMAKGNCQLQPFSRGRKGLASTPPRATCKQSTLWSSSSSNPAEGRMGGRMGGKTHKLYGLVRQLVEMGARS